MKEEIKVTKKKSKWSKIKEIYITERQRDCKDINTTTKIILPWKRHYKKEHTIKRKYTYNENNTTRKRTLQGIQYYKEKDTTTRREKQRRSIKYYRWWITTKKKKTIQR